MIPALLGSEVAKVKKSNHVCGYGQALHVQWFNDFAA